MANEKAADERMTVMAVAAQLGKRYQAARDMMLSGKLGAPTYEGRKLFVLRSAVDAYQKKVMA